MSKTIADGPDKSHPKQCGRMARELYVMAETMKSGEARTRTLMRAKVWDDKAAESQKYEAQRTKMGHSA